MKLTITPAAARFLRLMLLADGTADSGVRLAVSPGGCSGLSAELAVAQAPAAGEQAVTVDRSGIRRSAMAMSTSHAEQTSLTSRGIPLMGLTAWLVAPF